MKKPMIFEGIVAILIIILLFVLYLMVTDGGLTANNANINWIVVGNDTITDLYPASDGTLYAFMGDLGNNISAISPDGSVKWTLYIPAEWRVSNRHWGSTSSVITGHPDDIYPVYATDNGSLYLYLRENRITAWNYYSDDEIGPPVGDQVLKEKLVAISPKGSILWEAALNDRYYHPFSGDSLYANNGRVYAFSDYNVTVFDDKGSVLYRFMNVSDAPAVDGDGNIYLSAGNATTLYDELYMEPSGTIMAYSPDGSLYWQKSMDVPVERQDSAGYQYSTIPLYQGRTLYVPVKNGIYVLDPDGSLKWKRTIGANRAVLYHYMPIDSLGNVYFSCTNITMPQKYDDFMVMATGDGDSLINVTEPSHTPLKGDPDNGIIYDLANLTYSRGPGLFLNLTTIVIGAYDMADNKTVWECTLPVGEPTTLIIDANNASNKNVRPGIFQEALQKDREYKNYTPGTAPTRPYLIQSELSIMVLPSGGTTYVGYYTANYDWPLVLGKSRYAYASGVYAINRSGRLLWYKPADSLVTAMASTNNSTIFYGTRNGKVISGDAFAGGLAALAILYVFMHFFMAGTISRARSRLGLNANRNSVLKFIADNPGSTMSEISRGIRMNLGTVRYHLLILGVNHRIVANRPDGKSIRYFTNTGSYDDDEQSIVSLMRRDPMRKILELLVEKPRISNRELSRALDMQESAASRCMKELLEKGVIVRDDTSDGRYSYSIKNEYKERVAFAMERIN